MGMTIDEAIKELNSTKDYPASDPASDEALDFAIDIMRKYQQLQADYENRLKADMVAMLEDLDLQIDELSFSDEEPINVTQDYIDEVKSREYGKKDCKKLIQQKINALKAGSEE